MSADAELDLAAILAPVTEEAFFADHWDERPLVVSHRTAAGDSPGVASPYRTLLALEDVETILASGVLRHPQVRLLRADRLVAATEYSRHDATIDLERLRAEHAAGATIVLPDLDRSWTPLSDLCRRLERRFSRHVWTNVYLTPPDSQGFAPHHDTHDVLILQIAGTKEWRMYGAPVLRPLRSQQWDPSLLESAGAPRELTLSPGDLVYLPRGHVHAARTTAAGPSLHVTVAIDAFTWADLLSRAVDLASQSDADLRRSIPTTRAGDHDARTRLEAELARRLSAVSSSTAIREAVIESSESLLRSHVPEAPVDVERLSAQTRVRQRPRLHPRVEHSGDSVALVYDGGRLKGPKRIETALRFVADARDPFEVGALPGDLTHDGRLLLARRLVQDGFLSVLLYGTTPERA